MSNSIHVTPKINVLSSEAIVQVHKYSLKILSEIGIRIDSEKALKVFKSSQDVRFLDDCHVVIHPEVVEWAIQQAPSTIDIYTRQGDLSFRLGESTTRFGIGVTNLFYQEPRTDEILPLVNYWQLPTRQVSTLLHSFALIRDHIKRLLERQDIPALRYNRNRGLEIVPGLLLHAANVSFNSSMIVFSLSPNS